MYKLLLSNNLNLVRFLNTDCFITEKARGQSIQVIIHILSCHFEIAFMRIIVVLIEEADILRSVLS